MNSIDIKPLVDKAFKLNEGEVLHTSFGPDRYYVIEKEDTMYKLTEYRNKWNFQKYGNVLRVWKFENQMQLSGILLAYKDIYAKNVFTGNIVHLNNWKEFVNSFKLKKLVGENSASGETITYYYKEILN